MRWLWLAAVVGCRSGDPAHVVRSPTNSTSTAAPTGDTTISPPSPDSAAPDSSDSGCPDGVYDGPISLTEVTVTCDEHEFVTFAATTEGVGAAGLVFAMETANVPPWSEEDDLWPRAYDVCGFWSELEMRVISQGAAGAPAWYERNDASLFACGAHFETDPPVMSYVFTALDPTGQVADCVAIGADPQGLVDGAYDGAMINAPSFPIGACAVGLPAR